MEYVSAIADELVLLLYIYMAITECRRSHQLIYCRSGAWYYIMMWHGVIYMGCIWSSYQHILFIFIFTPSPTLS